ncbi:MAG: hypothetical protein HC909_04780 [Blastochloris sp.]|nr:hypothetical protein [Blastochloris sp.]
MAFASYGEFMGALERAGELRRIREPVATELEITALADREMKSPGGGRALLIEQPTVNGVVSPLSGGHQHPGFLQTDGVGPGRGNGGCGGGGDGGVDEAETAGGLGGDPEVAGHGL